MKERREEIKAQELVQKSSQLEEQRNLLGVGEGTNLELDNNTIKVPFIMETKIVALKFLSANDLKTRNTTSLPEPASQDIELDLTCITRNVDLRLKKLTMEKKAKKIRDENTNLSPENILGLKELSERKDLRIVLTDKSKKMEIVTQEAYDKMTFEYTKDAKEVNFEELKQREGSNNGHSC